jgi:dipeptidyl aminopeptidase/acylaminoacyl peptidase
VIFFQGLEDRVVPASQSEAMVRALERRGLRCAYVAFPGEQHGFRRAENIRTALEGELYFYAQIFGFETDVQPRGVHLSGGGAPR